MRLSIALPAVVDVDKNCVGSIFAFVRESNGKFGSQCSKLLLHNIPFKLLFYFTGPERCALLHFGGI